MKEDEERIKEVIKAREMKKALKKQKVKVRNGSLTCFVVPSYCICGSYSGQCLV